MLKEETRTLYKSHCPPLEEIIDNSYDSIFVTDCNGIVLLANPAASKLLNISQEELVGADVKDLVAKGYYNRSPVIEAIEERRVVNALIQTKAGINLMCTSRPLLDEEGHVKMVISNSRDKDMVEKFAVTLEKERAATKRYKHEVEYLRDKDFEKNEIIAKSRKMLDMLPKANTVAKTDSTVLLNGESGTGKEVLAKYIHRQSHRSGKAFITVNCAAIPENLLESELFGYEKGAFTGANTCGKPGLFEIADKGTIFLDEIGEMPLAVQPKLLRVLETSDVRRIGGTSSHKVDVRVICATNRDLKKMIEDKLFREDLYYRLDVIPFTIPPLRERPEDLLALSNTFLEEFNKKYGYKKILSSKTIAAFLNYPWPGNVRELRNVIERLVITTTESDIDYQGEPDVIIPERSAQEEVNDNYKISLPASGSLKDVIGMVEQQYIKEVLKECNGCVSEAARRLGIHRSVVYRKIS